MLHRFYIYIINYVIYIFLYIYLYVYMYIYIYLHINNDIVHLLGWLFCWDHTTWLGIYYCVGIKQLCTPFIWDWFPPIVEIPFEPTSNVGSGFVKKYSEKTLVAKLPSTKKKNISTRIKIHRTIASLWDLFSPLVNLCRICMYDWSV